MGLSYQRLIKWPYVVILRVEYKKAYRKVPPKIVFVVVTPPLPWDGGTARMAIQVHAVNLIKLG